MASRRYRLPLLLTVFCLILLLFVTAAPTAADPVCTSEGTGFSSTEPIMGWGKTVCGSACQYQTAQWCQTGTMYYTYDCARSEDGSYYPINVVGTPSHCQCVAWGCMLCC